jgi:hypothetical protein
MPLYDALDNAGSNNASEGSSVVRPTLHNEHHLVDASLNAPSLVPEDRFGPSPQISDSLPLPGSSAQEMEEPARVQSRNYETVKIANHRRRKNMNQVLHRCKTCPDTFTKPWNVKRELIALMSHG